MTLIFEEHARFKHPYRGPERKDYRAKGEYWVKYSFEYTIRPPSARHAYPSLERIEGTFARTLRQEFDPQATHPDKGVDYGIRSIFHEDGSLLLRGEVQVHYAKPGKMPRRLPRGFLLRVGVLLDQLFADLWIPYSEVSHNLRRFERKIMRFDKIEHISREKEEEESDLPTRPHHIFFGWKTNDGFRVSAKWTEENGSRWPNERTIRLKVTKSAKDNYLKTETGARITSQVYVNPQYGRTSIDQIEEDWNDRVQPALKKARQMRRILKEIFDEFSLQEARQFMATRQARYHTLNPVIPDEG